MSKRVLAGPKTKTLAIELLATVDSMDLPRDTIQSTTEGFTAPQEVMDALEASRKKDSAPKKATRSKATEAEK